jgi:hypothetical protein
MAPITRSQDQVTIYVPPEINSARALIAYIGANYGSLMARIARDYVANINWADVADRGIELLQQQLQHVYDNVLDSPDRERVRQAIEGAQTNQGRLGNLDLNEAMRNPGHQGIEEIGVNPNGDPEITSKSLFNLQSNEHN